MAPVSDPFKDNNAPYDDSIFSESDSEAEDTSVHSESITDYIPSETSNDRAFVISDTEGQSSHASSDDSAADEILARVDEVNSNSVRKVRFPAFGPWLTHRG